MTTDKDPTLPPLPEPSMEWPSLCRYNASEVEAYGMMCRKQALDEAAQAAVDAVAFNGGTIQTEAHVRAAIKELLK